MKFRMKQEIKQVIKWIVILEKKPFSHTQNRKNNPSHWISMRDTIRCVLALIAYYFLLI